MNSGLIVEDISKSREWLSQLLERAFPGIEITTCGTFIEAQDIIKKQDFSIALVDIGLPDVNGIELIQPLKSAHPNCYVVMTTIFDDENHLFSALKAGADGYLLKDAHEDLIIKKLKGIFSGDPPLSPSIARRMLRHFADQTDTPKRHDTVKLSPRETEVLTLVAKGLGRKEIAELLGLSSNTIARYIKDVYYKLNVSSRAEATIQACRMGLVNLNNY